MQHAFNVDLRGIVDLLSRHLYSSPRVYVRELLQNSADAITARRRIDGAAPASIRIEPREVTGDWSLRIHDTGIGLTEPQVHELLATIGRSSKRDEVGFARHEFLGQFGIGLLSCFLVADEVEVITRSGDAETVVWRGYADGHYTVDRGPAREEPGTTVALRARRDFAHVAAPRDRHGPRSARPTRPGPHSGTSPGQGPAAAATPAERARDGRAGRGAGHPPGAPGRVELTGSPLVVP